jgi:hypothetical protein
LPSGVGVWGRRKSPAGQERSERASSAMTQRAGVWGLSSGGGRFQNRWRVSMSRVKYRSVYMLPWPGWAPVSPVCTKRIEAETEGSRACRARGSAALEAGGAVWERGGARLTVVERRGMKRKLPSQAPWGPGKCRELARWLATPERAGLKRQAHGSCWPGEVEEGWGALCGPGWTSILTMGRRHEVVALAPVCPGIGRASCRVI